MITSPYNDKTRRRTIEIIESMKFSKSIRNPVPRLSEKETMEDPHLAAVMQGIDSFYQFNLPFFISKFIKEENNNEEDVVDKKRSNLYGENKYNFRSVYHASLNTTYYICRFLRSRKTKKIINFGTGSGASVVATGLETFDTDSEIITLDQVPVFNRISKQVIQLLREIGYQINNNISYINADLMPFKEHPLYKKYASFLESEFFNNRRLLEEVEKPLLSYNYIAEPSSFDMAIIDGPSCFRFPSFLQALNFVKPKGIIIFEGSKAEIIMLKSLGMKIDFEYGVPVKRNVETKLGVNKFIVCSTSILRNTKDLQSFFKAEYI